MLSPSFQLHARVRERERVGVVNISGPGRHNINSSQCEYNNKRRTDGRGMLGKDVNNCFPLLIMHACFVFGA